MAAPFGDGCREERLGHLSLQVAGYQNLDLVLGSAEMLGSRAKGSRLEIWHFYLMSLLPNHVTLGTALKFLKL